MHQKLKFMKDILCETEIKGVHCYRDVVMGKYWRVVGETLFFYNTQYNCWSISGYN